MAETSLLAADDPPPFEIVNPAGASAYLLVCDHASNRLPRSLGSLGLPDAELQRHIAWDIGAADVARHLATALDAALILQNYSRLAIDCNRPLDAPDSVATLSEATEIPGNRNLPPAAIAARRADIFAPYHACIAANLDARRGANRPTILVAVHSFTPVFKGVVRPWQVGVLYHRDVRLARILLDLFRAEGDLTIGDNKPYAMDDGGDYTIPTHGEKRSLPHVELEIRQNLIADAAGQSAWASRLARIFPRAASPLGAEFSAAQPRR